MFPSHEQIARLSVRSPVDGGAMDDLSAPTRMWNHRRGMRNACARPKSISCR